MPSELEQLFLNEGKTINIPAGSFIFLHDTENLLWVEEGEFDVFALESHYQQSTSTKFAVFPKEKMQGTLTFLHDATVHHLLFPFPSTTYKHRIVLVAITQGSLRTLSLNEIAEFQESNPASTHELMQQLSSWTYGISSIFKGHHPKKITHYLQSSFKSTLQVGECVAVPHIFEGQRDGNVCLKVTQGRLNLLGIFEISLTPQELICPMTPTLWWESTEQSQIEIVTEDRLKILWPSLLRFQQMILDVIAYDDLQKSSKEQAAFSLQEVTEQEQLDATLKSMGAILTEKQTLAIPRTRDRLLQACQIIGNRIDRIFLEPIDFEKKTRGLEERLYQVSVSSDVYYRNVLLAKGWWKRDQGPLLAYIEGPPTKPVALLPTSPGQYEMMDPEGKIQKVEEQQAEQLKPKGAMFYRAFPNKSILAMTDILNFCIKGRGNELLTIFLVSILGIILGLFVPFANQKIFDEVIPYIDSISFAQILIGLAVVFISTSIFTLTREYAILRTQSYLNHDVEAALWERLLELSPNFFRRYTIGNLIQRIYSIGDIRRKVSGQAIGVMINGVFSTIYLAAMLYYSPILTLVGLGIVLLGFVVTATGFFLCQKLERQHQDLLGIINGKIVQIIFGLSKIRTHGVENRFFSYWAQNSIQSQKLSLQIGNTRNAVNVANNLIQTMKFLVIFGTIIALLQPDRSGDYNISLGTYLAFNAAFISFSIAVFEFSNILMEMIVVYPMWQRSKVILHEPIETNIDKMQPGILSGDVKVVQLSFRYNRNSPLVLDNISIQAEPGEFIAIVGPSGCGKSTLVRMLLGFETPENGAVYYDDKDLAHLNLKAVRNQMRVILQNSSIIDGTIRDNILGGSIANDAEIMQAVKKAGFEEDLKLLPMGLATALTTGGLTLSGGQRQRLLIARALLTKAPILIWDEATNALDNQTQAVVFQNLEKLEMTRIVIAHRVSTIHRANRIYVMDKGRIIESGTFSELSSREGLFRDILACQTL